MAGHNGVKFTYLCEETFLQIKDGWSTGALLYILGTPFTYGGMTLKASCAVYLRKDLLPVALKNLLLVYPELADKDDSKKIEEEVDKCEEKDIENDDVKEDNDNDQI